VETKVWSPQACEIANGRKGRTPSTSAFMTWWTFERSSDCWSTCFIKMYQKNSDEFLFKVCVNFVDSYPKKTILWKRAVYIVVQPSDIGFSSTIFDAYNCSKRGKLIQMSFLFRDTNENMNHGEWTKRSKITYFFEHLATKDCEAFSGLHLPH
jgi:hypothetical protein